MIQIHGIMPHGTSQEEQERLKAAIYALAEALSLAVGQFLPLSLKLDFSVRLKNSPKNLKLYVSLSKELQVVAHTETFEIMAQKAGFSGAIIEFLGIAPETQPNPKKRCYPSMFLP